MGGRCLWLHSPTEKKEETKGDPRVRRVGDGVTSKEEGITKESRTKEQNRGEEQIRERKEGAERTTEERQRNRAEEKQRRRAARRKKTAEETNRGEEQRRRQRRKTKEQKRGGAEHRKFFFSSSAERAITAVPVTALPNEAFVTSSKMPRFHQAETPNKRTQNQQQPSKTNNATPTTPKPKTKHLSGNRVAYFCTTYN